MFAKIILLHRLYTRSRLSFCLSFNWLKNDAILYTKTERIFDIYEIFCNMCICWHPYSDLVLEYLHTHKQQNTLIALEGHWRWKYSGSNLLWCQLHEILPLAWCINIHIDLPFPRLCLLEESVQLTPGRQLQEYPYIPLLVYMAVMRNHQYRYYKPYRCIYRQHKPCHIGMDGKIPLPTFWFILLSCWECWRCYSRDIFMRSFTSPFAIWKKFFPCTTSNCLLWEGNVRSTFLHLKKKKLISTDINLMRKTCNCHLI